METRQNKIFTITATVKEVLPRGFTVSIVERVKVIVQLTSVAYLFKTQRMCQTGISLSRLDVP